MATIQESASAYEDWLRKQLDGDLVAADLDRKHEKMAKSPFVFLRATYWRWAETIFELCPELADGPSVLAVGDIHLENYGTWRDADGRLVWGVNDFDEAAEMPYALDLVRLAASAMLGRPANSIGDDDIGKSILNGYGAGLKAPQPIVLDREHHWLREHVEVSEEERKAFWDELDELTVAAVRGRYRTALAEAMPEHELSFKAARRTAGSGSLGRPRWVGVADWRGAEVIREAKALVTSAWCLVHDKEQRKVRAGEIADGRYRSADPWYRVKKKLVVRRLSPNNRKIEVKNAAAVLFTGDMLYWMGFELANVHLGVVDRRSAIGKDLKKRKAGWLIDGARKVADAIKQEHEAWKATFNKKAGTAKAAAAKAARGKRETA